MASSVRTVPLPEGCTRSAVIFSLTRSRPGYGDAPDVLFENLLGGRSGRPTLERLLGRPPTPFRDVLAVSLPR